MRQDRRRLSANDWTEAALTALGEGGVPAVAVEPLAARLGTTKGSFYWHFANREALLEAALSLWEQRFTEATISAVAAEPDPAARLRMLFTRVSRDAEHSPVSVSVLASAGHELVGPVVRRVMERRMSYVIGLFEEVGFPPEVALQRAVLGLTAHVGHSQLAVRLPGLLPLGTEDRLDGYIDAAVELLLHDAPGPKR
ncbi:MULTISPECIES: TetR/AcrR family transcriptional regulator [unclassified Streptomyces]|uniref:TetR/AcrR family transcriptional regulator n=1 Tax=unclassified Streptomyces TaxID=2593676 RepID=UPI002E2F63FC|nr:MULTISPECIES: TetR/AcrR family transcriptional regulator [unclassified Streptomyces]WUC68100.1 TetR/AcrR family transcriptional regulator [Streptomyces sp. NBC_00539]